MKVTVDRVGRIVIPKPLRIALGIGPDTELEVLADGAGLRLEPVRPPSRGLVYVDGLPILAPVDGHRLTDADVQRMRDDVNWRDEDRQS